MIYIYSNREGFLEKPGLFKISKSVFKLKYRNGILQTGNKRIKTDKPFLFIEKLIRRYRLYAVGFITYDYGEKIVGIKNSRKKILNLPEIYLVFFKSFKKVTDTESTGYNKINRIEFLVSKQEFISSIKKAKRYIEQGDIYQINLSHPISVEGNFDRKYIFKNLINLQPTPFMLFIDETEFSLISGSMELFLKKEGNKIVTKPIKGTRPRGKDKDEDKNLKYELEKSEKEMAENLMITDLMRNDLGKICEKGGVKVEKLFEIESYSTLFQMSSTVSGILKEDVSLQEIVDATFPPGSVTGAPKKRAMEIIAELEPFRRSVYCGATVLLKPDLNFVMSVAIRQIIFQRNKAFIYVGSGIVSDSKPEEEYRETVLKAKANLKAIGVAA